MTSAAEVDAFLGGSGHPRRADVQRLRAALLASIPGLEEHVKWNAPSFVHGGDDRLTFRLQPGDRCQLVFHRGAKVRADAADFSFEDPTGRIVWATPDRGVLTVAPLDDAEVDAIVLVAGRWVAATAT